MTPTNVNRAAGSQAAGRPTTRRTPTPEQTPEKKRKKSWDFGPVPDDVFGAATDKPPALGPQARHVTFDERMEALVRNPGVYSTAAFALPDRRAGSVGRPRAFPPYIFLIFSAAISIFGSARSTQAYLSRPTWWEIVVAGVRTCLGDEEADSLPVRGPSSSQWYYFRLKMIEALPSLREASRDAWIGQALEIGLLAPDGPQGTWIRPDRSHVIHGDGTVTKPPSDHTHAETVDEETGEIRRHRVDPDAGVQTEGGGRQVYGNKYLTIATRLAGTAHSRMILNLDAVRIRSRKDDPEKLDEAAAAVKIATEVIERAPGVKAITYDTALRGVHRAPLIRQGVVVFTKQHDGLTPHELLDFREGSCRHPLYAAEGRACERKITVDGKVLYVPLPVRELEVRGKIKKRFYQRIEIPCRKGGHQVRIRIDETEEDRSVDSSNGKQKFNRTEHLRQIPPDTPAGRRLVGFRQDSESTNSRLDQSFPLNRLPAYGSKAGLLIVIGFAWSQNALAWALHRRK